MHLLIDMQLLLNGTCKCICQKIIRYYQIKNMLNFKWLYTCILRLQPHKCEWIIRETINRLNLIKYKKEEILDFGLTKLESR